MNAISFTLFGDLPIYTRGAIRNAEMARDFFSGWTPVFFVDAETVSMGVVDKIEAAGGLVRFYSSHHDPNGMFVRFSIGDDPEVERFLARDVDSRPCQREVNAVNAWIESGKAWHIMRDHPYHAVPMLGGLWGACGGAARGITAASKKFRRYSTPYTRETAYGADQEFLMQFAWPKAQKDMLCHDSFTRDRFPGGVPFPDGLKLGQWRFCGEIFDENDQPDAVHWQQRANGMVPA